MARYDWERGYGRMSGYDSAYDSWGDAWHSGSRGGFWGEGGGGYRQRGSSDQYRGFEPGWGYDRGIYGGNYPTYGGFPGGVQRGMYYGGPGGYDEQMYRWGGSQFNRGGRGYDWITGSGPQGSSYGGGYAGSGTGRSGYDYDVGDAGYGTDISGGYGNAMGNRFRAEREPYDAGYSRAPFVPEEAYRRHPEMNRPPEHVQGRWPGYGDQMGVEEDMDDEEIRQAVRSNLHQDSWIQAERIQVDVNDGVVTLAGEVDDYMQSRYAWDDAWEAPGVHGVINNLTVRTDQSGESHGDVVPQTSGGKRKK